MIKKIKIIYSSPVFITIVSIFIITMAFITCDRGGKDLKVGLFGVEQVLQKKSPYDNPTDPNRPLFRYAPGFAILQYPFLLNAKMFAPFEFKDLMPSVLAWYLLKILILLITAGLLFRLIPSVSKETSIRNIKISFLLALPLIGYELSNGQNKLIALFFMLVSIFLFEKNRLFLSAILFNLALTVYIPLLPFVLYFILRNKRYILSFTASALIVFIIIPSLVFGFSFNAYLLKEWFARVLKPFISANSYVSYIDLRSSSQSLPSALGRIFVSGNTRNFKFAISPVYIHIIIKILSAIIVLFSCLAARKQSKSFFKGLGYSIFLILALILPQYCIYYTWCWIFVLYFAVFNYVSYPEVSVQQKKALLFLVSISFLSICLIEFHTLNRLSLIFWTTILLWFGMLSAGTGKLKLR